MTDSSPQAPTPEAPSQGEPLAPRRWLRWEVGVALIALVAVGVIVAWKGLEWGFHSGQGPGIWVEAGKPLTERFPANPLGTTTIDIHAETTVDVCVSDAEGQLPLFCSRGRAHHSLRIDRWPAAPLFTFENPRRVGRVRIEIQMTLDRPGASAPATSSQKPSISLDHVEE